MVYIIMTEQTYLHGQHLVVTCIHAYVYNIIASIYNYCV